MAEARDWSWSRDRGDVVLPEQPETAVYVNGDGFVVVRQQGWPDDDAVVVVDPGNVRRLAEAMLEAAGLDIASSATAPKVKDSTAAERQRRYRDRRNGETDRNVTRDGAVTPAVGDLLGGADG